MYYIPVRKTKFIRATHRRTLYSIPKNDVALSVMPLFAVVWLKEIIR